MGENNSAGYKIKIERLNRALDECGIELIKERDYFSNDAFRDTLNKMVTGGDTLFEIFDVLKSMGRERDAKKLEDYYSNMKMK